MTWYTAWYGSWAKGDKVTTIECEHGYGTYNRKEIFARAQEIADEHNVVVTVSAERPTGSGLQLEHYKVIPKEA